MSNEDSILENLHSVLQAKQGLVTDEEESEVESDGSAVVITDPVGSVNKIREFFQGELLQPNGETPDSVSEVATCFIENHSGVESKHSPCALDENTVKHAEHPNHVNGQETCVSDKVKRAEKNPRQLEKKRKLTASTTDSEKSNESVNCKANKMDGSVLEDVTCGLTPNSQSKADGLYPVFNRKGVDAKDQKVPKEQREQKKGKSNKKKQKASQPAEPSESGADQAAAIDEGNLQVLDVRTVLSLYDKVKHLISEDRKCTKQEMAKFKQDITKELENAKKILKEEMEKDVQKSMEMYEDQVKRLEEKIRSHELKESKTAELLVLNEQVVNDLASRLDALELAAARRSAILSGLSFSTKKHERNLQLEDFFHEVLDLRVEVDDSYQLGVGENKPTVIIFGSCKDKSRVFEKKDELQGIEGEAGRSIYINSYLPSKIKERKKREQDIIHDIKKEQEAGSSVTYEKTPGGLKIDTKPYTKKVTAPDPTSILDMSAQELDEILQKETVKGVTLTVNLSSPIQLMLRIIKWSVMFTSKYVCYTLEHDISCARISYQAAQSIQCRTMLMMKSMGRAVHF